MGQGEVENMKENDRNGKQENTQDYRRNEGYKDRKEEEQSKECVGDRV